MTERKDLIVMGRILGTYDGWEGELECLLFYNYVPNTMASLAGLVNGDLTVDLLRGQLAYTNDDGSIRTEQDAIPILLRLPRKIPEY